PRADDGGGGDYAVLTPLLRRMCGCYGCPWSSALSLVPRRVRQLNCHARRALSESEHDDNDGSSSSSSSGGGDAANRSDDGDDGAVPMARAEAPHANVEEETTTGPVMVAGSE